MKEENKNYNVPINLGRNIGEPFVADFLMATTGRPTYPIFVTHNYDPSFISVKKKPLWVGISLVEIEIPSKSINSIADIITIVKEHESRCPTCAIICKDAFERIFENSENLVFFSSCRDNLLTFYSPIIKKINITNSTIVTLDNDKSIATKANELLSENNFKVFSAVADVTVTKDYISDEHNFYFPPEFNSVLNKMDLKRKWYPHFKISHDPSEYERIAFYKFATKNCPHCVGLSLNLYVRHGFSYETANSELSSFDDINEVLEESIQLMHNTVLRNPSKVDEDEVLSWERDGEDFLKKLVEKHDLVKRGLDFNSESYEKLRRFFSVIGEYKGHGVDYYIQQLSATDKATICS